MGQPHEVSRLAACGIIRRAKLGEVVLQALETAMDAVVILEGIFVQHSVSGHEVARFGRGETVGDISMLLQAKRHTSLKCHSDSGLCLAIRHESYVTCMGKSRKEVYMVALLGNLGRSLGVVCPCVAAGDRAARDLEEEDDEDDEDESLLGLSPQMLATSCYLRRRSAMHAKWAQACPDVPSYEEFIANDVWPQVSERERIENYFAVKALAVGLWSAGYCPHYEAPFDNGDGSVVVFGDRDSYLRVPALTNLLDSRASGRYWTSVLVEPHVPNEAGETYVEWQVLGSTSEPLDIMVGVCGEDAADAIRSGGIAWRQADAYMYYLGSGFKYSGGLSLNFGPGTTSGPQVKVHDTVGLLVETYPLSRSNSNGARVSLFVNGKNHNQLFSERSLKRGDSSSTAWPDTVYFAVDVLTPGVTLRLLRKKTWRTRLPSLCRRNAVWDDNRNRWTL